jgi:hypothetical protein
MWFVPCLREEYYMVSAYGLGAMSLDQVTLIALLNDNGQSFLSCMNNSYSISIDFY